MQRILQPGELEKPRGDIEETLLPTSGIFVARAMRCRQLAAQGGALATYLDFVAHLGTLQQKELDAANPGIERREMFLPSPCFASRVNRLAKQMLEIAPEKTVSVLESLLAKDSSWIDGQVTALVAGNPERVSVATAPIVGAALQVEWVHGIMQRGGELPVARHKESTVCPLCGGMPVAGVIDGRRGGLRYLYCAFCGTGWHMVRAKCSCCGESKGVDYFFSEEIAGYIRIEACSSCKTYLKLFLTEKESAVDVWADDLFTFVLDLRMTEMGYAKSGVNIFLLADKVSGISVGGG